MHDFFDGCMYCEMAEQCGVFDTDELDEYICDIQLLKDIEHRRSEYRSDWFTYLAEFYGESWTD